MCNPIFTGIIQIGVTFWYAGETDQNGDKIVMAKGFDGKLYRLVECRHNPPHVKRFPTITEKASLSTERKHVEDSTDGETEPFF